MFAILASLGALLGVPVDASAVVEHPAVTIEIDAAPVVSAPVLLPSPAIPPQGRGCSRVGTFTRAELAECFGPWAGVAWCESSGDSTALNPRDVNGRTSHGLFQFQLATWDATASHAGRTDLVGVDPATFPADVQFAMAVHHAEAMGMGLRPWGCGWAFGG